MDFVDASGTRYQLAEAVEAPAPAKKATIWPWIVGGLTLAGGLVWMASIRSRKANPVNPAVEALVAEARDPATSFLRLVELLRCPDSDVQRALLDNQNILPTKNDGSLQTIFLTNLARQFPEEVATHPLFVFHALIEPSKDVGNVVMEVVQRTADVGLIDHLWRTWGYDWSIRYSITKNPNTPVDLIYTLSNKQTEPSPLVYNAAQEALAVRGLT